MDEWIQSNFCKRVFRVTEWTAFNDRTNCSGQWVIIITFSCWVETKLPHILDKLYSCILYICTAVNGFSALYTNLCSTYCCCWCAQMVKALAFWSEVQGSSLSTNKIPLLDPCARPLTFAPSGLTHGLTHALTPSSKAKRFFTVMYMWQKWRLLLFLSQLVLSEQKVESVRVQHRYGERTFSFQWRESSQTK